MLYQPGLALPWRSGRDPQKRCCAGGVHFQSEFLLFKYAQTKKEIDQEIIDVGKRTVIDLGINGLHPELIKYVGRMKYRSSYGQNLLQHSKEVAKLCAIMSSELGIDPKSAKRAGLLHDIGRLGTMTQDWLLAQDSDWHREKLGNEFKINFNSQQIYINK